MCICCVAGKIGGRVLSGEIGGRIWRGKIRLVGHGEIGMAMGGGGGRRLCEEDRREKVLRRRFLDRILECWGGVDTRIRVGILIQRQ